MYPERLTTPSTQIRSYFYPKEEPPLPQRPSEFMDGTLGGWGSALQTMRESNKSRDM